MPSRRQFLRYSLVGGLGLVPLCRTGFVLPAADAVFCTLPTAQAATGASAIDVPRFVAPLRLPRVLSPVRSDGATDYYELVMRTGTAEIVAGVQTPIWGYDGEYPGPTIRTRPGRAVVVRQTNQLPSPTSVHLHGGHVAPDSDGHPNDLIQPGRSKDYHYPNTQLPATLWYHDHAAHVTAEQVYRGLAAFYLLADDEADAALGIPTGDRDIPLVIQDRSFNADGTLAYDSRNHNGFLGDVYVTNGVAWPYFEVAATSYRLRILNGSNSRQYELALSSGQPLTQTATDGGLLAAPVSSASIPLAPAERVEVVVDFSALPVGSSLVLSDGPGAAATPILRFDVARSGPPPAPLASRLRTVEALGAAAVTRDVELGFDEATGRWVFDGLGFDPGRVDAHPRLGTVERWRLRNVSHMSHPIHLHLVMFQVLDRNGAAPPAYERGWKDTVRVRPGETVTIAARFSGHTGTFVYHCHNLEHEDHDMMAQFRVVDLARLAGAGRVETAAAISAATFAPGVPAVFVATAGGFADALAGGPAAATVGAPVLLTTGDQLPGATKDELRRLAPDGIVVLGGQAAVPAAVEDELRAFGPVNRLAGESRYATAAAISRAYFQAGVAVAYVATGADFPDALAGGAAAAAVGGSVLLVGRDSLPADTAAELDRLRAGRLVVLGGRGAVSDAVVEQLHGYTTGGVSRLAGPSRYDTAAAIVRAAFPGTAETVFVATGATFPDALAGVPAAAAQQAPLLLVAPDHIPEVIADELRRLRPARIRMLGGQGAISAAVEAGLLRYLES